MDVLIPGFKKLELENVLLDFNGTLATDGKISVIVKNYLRKVAEKYHVYVITADTHHSVSRECRDLPICLRTFESDYVADAKLAVIEQLGGESCVAIGNGRNDIKMLQQAALSIAVLDQEGIYAPLLINADVATKSIEDALAMLLDEKRLIATLRG